MVSPPRRHWRRFARISLVALGAISWALSSFAWAESGKRPRPVRQSEKQQGSGGRVYAESSPAVGSRFLPTFRQTARYPLALHGYSAIDLRDRQQWVAGIAEHQALFDGQLYWFADARQRAIFAAVPQRYLPVLGGDCVVTFSETGDRVPGDLRYGLRHQQRLFFFAGQQQREQFQADPESFVDVDLAHNGNCVVSKIDQRQAVQGLPKTVATVGGLRYHFLGTQQRRQFIGNLARYGAEIIIAADPGSSQVKQDSAPSKDLIPEDPPKRTELSKSESSADSSEMVDESQNKVDEINLQPTSQISADARLALSGYCPVTIRDNGTWEEGDYKIRLEYDGRIYRFLGEPEKALFAKNPASYIPALAGDCVVSLVESNRQIPGSLYHMADYGGRLFLFVGADEKKAFKADKLAYADVDLVIKGNCIVTHVDQGETVAGLPESLIWFRNKRYFFASQEMKEKFLADPEHYANPLSATSNSTSAKQIPPGDENNPGNEEQEPESAEQKQDAAQ